MVSLKHLQNKPLEEHDDFSISWSWVWIATLYFFAAGTLSASFLSFEGKGSISARLMFRLFGLGAIATAVGKTREVQYLSKYSGYREVLREDNFISRFVGKPNQAEVSQADGDDDEIAIYDWQRLRSEATGIAIFGNPGSAKTSTALWALGWLTQSEPANIDICHPHAGVDRSFEYRGLKPVSKYSEIEKIFADALNEFKARVRRAEEREYIGAPYFLVADETDSYERNFKNKDLFHEVQTVLGKEGRKYGMTLVFISHTSNVTNKKIDAQERDCFTSINLGTSAVARAKTIWGKKSAEYKILNEQAYPCFIISGGIPSLAIHPTHGEYSEYKKEGLAPKHLLPIQQIHDFGQPPATNIATEQPSVATDWLKRIWSLEFDMDSHQLSHQPPDSQPATEDPYSCPECGSHRTKWHDKKNGRRKCNKCHSTWRV